MEPASSSPIPATPPPRLKRRLLAQAVEENLALIEGRRLPRRPGRRRARSLVWSFALGACLAAAAPLLLSFETREPAAATARLPAAAPAPESVHLESAGPLPTRLSPEVFPLELRRIVLDPGHGGSDLGTSLGSLHEKDLTLDIARRVRGRLGAAGYDVQLTRDEDRRLVLAERAELANRARADLFVSIHVNWFADRGESRGVETYFLGPTEDPYLTELASAENAESGYSRADTRRLLDRIYGDLRSAESQAVAGSVQRALLASLRQVNPRLADRGIKQAPFLVLTATEMPAILAEVSCLSNREEVELLRDAGYREKIAEALVSGVLNYAGGEAPRTAKRSG